MRLGSSNLRIVDAFGAAEAVHGVHNRVDFWMDYLVEDIPTIAPVCDQIRFPQRHQVLGNMRLTQT